MGKSLLLVLSIFIIVNTIISNQEPVFVVVINENLASNNQMIVPIYEYTTEHFRSNTQSMLRYIPIVMRNTTESIGKICDLISDGIVGLIDMTSPKFSSLLRALSKDLRIAYISLIDSSYSYLISESFLTNGTDIYIESINSQMLRILADIAERESLTSVALFYDETFDIQTRRVLNNVPVPHIYLPLTGNSSRTEQQINHIIKINIKTVVVIADVRNAQNFLNLLTRKQILNFEPTVIILTKNAKFDCPDCQRRLRLILITAIHLPEFQQQYLDYLRNAGIDNQTEEENIKLDETFAYDAARLVLMGMDIARQSGMQLLSVPGLDCYDLDAPVNHSHETMSQLLIKSIMQSFVSGVLGPLSWQPLEGVFRYNLSLKVVEVVLEDGKKRSEVLLAEWTQDGHLKMSADTLIKYVTRKRYKVVTIPNIPPFVYKSMSAQGSAEYSGLCIEFLERIAENLGFDYDIYETDQVGSRDESGAWSGVIQELIDGGSDNEANILDERRRRLQLRKIKLSVEDGFSRPEDGLTLLASYNQSKDFPDIAVGPISVMSEREEVIDFTVPYYDLVGLTILMKKGKVDYSLVKFLSVMDEQVWGCIIGAFCLFSVLICVFDRLSPFSYQNRRSQWQGEGEEPRIFTLKESFWFCMMSLTPQGGGETPKALSGRLIAATWWLFGFVIIATYTANLAAFLTVSRLETSIETLDDLSKQGKIQYAPENGSMAMIYFQRMADIEFMFYEIWKNLTLNDNLGVVNRAQLAVWDYPVSDKYTKLWEAMQQTTFPSSVEAAVNRVLNEDFAFISDATTIKYQASVSCDVIEVGEEFSRKPYAFAVQEGSPLKAEINNAILKLINNRTMEELKTKWWKRDAKECPKDEDEGEGISIRNIGGVFLVIVIGSVLSLTTLAMECYWYRIRPRRQKKKSKIPNSSPQAESFETSLNPERVKSNDHTQSENFEETGAAEVTGMDRVSIRSEPVQTCHETISYDGIQSCRAATSPMNTDRF